MSNARLWLLGALILPRAALPSLVPKPASLQAGDGHFVVDANTAIRLLPDTPETRRAARVLPFAVRAASRSIRLRLAPGRPMDLEGYELSVTSGGVEIQARAWAGLFYGAQTLRQMLPASTPGRIAAVHIQDSPRFRWRGLLLDCSRSFLPVHYLERTIDRMAFYKLNVLQLHLTDDEGWRLEIRRYPELTRRASRFAPAYGGAGGFYSQVEVRDLVSYASARNVTIVPEIEMPGHSQAELVAYPELRCDVPLEQPLEMSPFFAKLRIQRDLALCAGNDKTFEVSEGVLSEVMRMFPSAFLHIGGDEVSSYWWERCPKCQALMIQKRLGNTNELQAHFIGRIARFVAARGRRMVGWDEITEGGLAPGAVVMGWRGFEPAKAAAHNGHDVVLSPTRHCYFDYSPASLPAKRVYAFDPGREVDPARLLGVQAAMWTHIAITEKAIDFQIYPRLLVLAEVAWSPQAVRNWDDFSARLVPQLARLVAMGIRYHDESLPMQRLGGWQPGELTAEAKVFEWDATPRVASAGEYEVQVRRESGASRVYVEWVALAENGREISRESFPGAMYGPYQTVAAWLVLAKRDPGARYAIRARVRGARENDMTAGVWFARREH